jgi:hypothetical protein
VSTGALNIITHGPAILKLLLRCNVYNYYSENATYTKFTEDIPAKRNNFTTASSIVNI